MTSILNFYISLKEKINL